MPLSQSSDRVVLDSPQALATAAAAWVADCVTETLTRRDTCAIALSGGRTPQPVHAALARGHRDLDWARIHVYFADERAVPPDDPNSNYRMARESLLDGVPLPAANVHRMEAERADLDAAAREYERLLPILDVLLLGIGPDGHTASLFPGAPTLEERSRRVVPADSPFPPPRRLTVTPPVIGEARRTAMIVSGGDKATVVARALEGPVDPRALPAQLALGATWFLDRAAAAALTGAST